jgi:hypothetical protein
MGACRDISVTFLKESGYNVVRHPNAALQPLDLVGVQKGEPLYLGPLNLLVTNPPGPLPQITRNTVAAGINGKKSSTLKIGIGVTVLGNIIGAMGGNLGAEVSYTNARQIEFTYSDVLNDAVVSLAVGNYLRAADVDAGNLVLKQYALGNGRLYLVTKTAKSDKISVAYERSSGVAASVDVPVLQGVAGGSIKIDSSQATQGRITFSGAQQLVFGFQAFQVGVADGVLSLTSVKAGQVFLSVDQPGGDKPSVIETDGLLDLGSL